MTSNYSITEDIPARPDADDILPQQVKMLYANSYGGIVAAAGCAFAITWIMYGIIPGTILFTWAGLNVLFSLVQYVFVTVYLKRFEMVTDHHFWSRLFMVWIFFFGSLIGSVGIYGFPDHHYIYQMVILFLMVGMTAGSVGTMSVRFESYIAFSFPVMIPITVRFFISGADTEKALGVLCLIFYMIMVVTAKRMFQSMVDMLMLRFEREGIIVNLRASEEKFYKAFHTNAVMLGITTADDGIFIDVNQGFLATTGFTREDLLGRSIFELHVYKNIEEREMVRDRVKKEGKITNLDVEFLTRAGEPRYGIMSVSSLLLQGEECYLFMIDDITDRKIYQDELESSEKRFRHLSITMSDYIWETDPEFRFTYLSRDALDFLGDDIKDIYKTTPFIFLNQVNETLIEFVKEVFSTKAPLKDLEVQLLNKEGEIVFFLINGVPYYDRSGAFAGYRGTAKEITQQKKTLMELIKARENAESAMRAKSNFLAKMSHEIRTPMNAIIGMTDLALMTIDDEERNDYLNIIKESSDVLLRIINDILDFSKIESGRMTLESRSFNLHGLLESIMTSQVFTAREKGISMNLFIDPAVDEYLKGDPMRLRQVMTNILGNAQKFTDSGSIDVRVIACEDHSGGTDVMLQFSITDTGIGIPADRIDAIFDSFTQAEASITRKYGGTGLGLAICKELVEMMGGTIGVKSSEGKGSTFYFTAVLGKSDRDRKKIQQEAIVNNRGSAPEREYSVLLAEDNNLNARLAEVVLKKLGCRVTIVQDGIELLQKLKNGHYDLILMDIEMPRMNGIDASLSVRNGIAGEDNITIPIIAMTAHLVEEIGDQCSNAGINHIITKPISITELGPVIDSVMSSVDID